MRKRRNHYRRSVTMSAKEAEEAEVRSGYPVLRLTRGPGGALGAHVSDNVRGETISTHETLRKKKYIPVRVIDALNMI